MVLPERPQARCLEAVPDALHVFKLQVDDLLEDVVGKSLRGQRR